MTRVKLLLADDHEIVREGLRSLLGARRDFEIVGEAADGREAVALVEELKPDIVILDISMPLLNGLEATRQILKMRPRTKVLILTMHESDSLVREILDVGARGYILKTDVGNDLVAAVESLHRNKAFFTSGVSQMKLDGYLKGPLQSRRGHPEPSRFSATQASKCGSYFSGFETIEEQRARFAQSLSRRAVQSQLPQKYFLPSFVYNL
jgi:DNA-binding NarL/FixJ family response regulator